MERSLLPLCFATFFQCAVKPYSGFSQKKCFYILVYGEADPSVVTYQPTLISAFNKGTKPLPEHIRNLLSSLPQKVLNDRIRALGIQDPVSCADSLKRLISISTLSAESKEILLAQYTGSDPHTFVTLVFQNALQSSASLRQISHKDQDALFSYCANGTRLPDVPLNSDTASGDNTATATNAPVDSGIDDDKKAEEFCGFLAHMGEWGVSHPHPVLGHYETDAETISFKDWLTDYNLPSDISNPSEHPAAWVKHYRIELPRDIILLLHFNYIISADTAFISLDPSDLYTVAHLDLEKWCIQDGHIELYEIHAQPNDIGGLIRSLPEHDATDMLMWCQLNVDQTLDFLHDLCQSANELSPDAVLLSGGEYYGDCDETTVFLLIYTPDKKKTNASSAKPNEDHLPNKEDDAFNNLLKRCGLWDSPKNPVQDDTGPEIPSFLKPMRPKNQ